ncbi:NADH-quinone oxidoreductase subunit L [Streptomyces sp. HSG2]|uniref:NADH-quinone oxidoreductase subunit 5 family protein n=1 Tax=Streptomyces sp. HSG2 TaxID=2797167 RepID=UPI0019031A96|nr:NADH-quinone oxidoreductase subunit L [Streptomyces sp. HSG2]
MTTISLAVLVPLLPFLGAVVALFSGGRAPGFARPLAVLPTLAALALAVAVAARQGGGATLAAATELTPTGSIPIELALYVDGFAALVAVLVAFVATAVQVYSTGYLAGDPRYPSYAALISLFTSAMLLVVYSGDLMLLLVGWEVMGICSYFLIGHHWETSRARSAAPKAFLVTKLGDVPFLIGLFALATDTGSFALRRILDTVAAGDLDHPTPIALLLLAGVAGKSAQFPLHTWLPDAMAGPTPVSALIHAATMVAAGVYLVARLLPVFTASGAAMIVLAVMASVTMVGSGLAALAQDDVKRVLAYSTMGQLGYMVGALAVADRGAAVFHLLAHGAFKALLFLAAGVLALAVGTHSLAAMSGMRGVRHRVPDAFWTMTIALLALAAVPPFSGFFSKESVLGTAERAVSGHIAGVPAASGGLILVSGVLAALLTGAYATRLWLLAFRGDGPEAPDRVRRPVVLDAVLWALAVPSLAFGGIAFRVIPEWFDGGELAPTLTTSVLGTGVALAGGLLTWGAWLHTRAARHRASPLPPEPRATDPGAVLLGPLYRHAALGFHLDRVYTRLFVRPILAGATLVRFLDREVVDTYVRGAGALPRLLGAAARRAQTGNVQTYLTALLAGTVVLAVAAVLAATGA